MVAQSPATRTVAEHDGVPARVRDARELREAVFELPWGPKPQRDARREVRAVRRAMDALTRAEVALRRAGVAATPQHREACRLAVHRLATTVGELAAVVGDRIAWVFQVLHTVARAEAATDPAVCTVLDEDVRSERRTLTDFRFIEHGRSEALEPVTRGHRKGADKTNKAKPGKYRKRNAALLRLYKAVARDELKALRSARDASAEAFRQIAREANVTVKRAREIIAEARQDEQKRRITLA